MEESKMDLRELRMEGMESLNLAQDRNKWWALVNTLTNHEVPGNARNFFAN
jgi:hypothetical protein